MAEKSESIPTASDSRDELRTMSFRMREIQHLLAMRVAQENRRLAAEGLDPVEDPPFVERHQRGGNAEE
ncbi:hypothetical protein ACKVMT_09620 [Halobacteriales archaeon Cl-PHB]